EQRAVLPHDPRGHRHPRREEQQPDAAPDPRADVDDLNAGALRRQVKCRHGCLHACCSSGIVIAPCDFVSRTPPGNARTMPGLTLSSAGLTVLSKSLSCWILSDYDPEGKPTGRVRVD